MALSPVRASVATCLSVCLTLTALCLGVATQQIPLSFPAHEQPNLDFTSSAPHIFSSLRYLLEQWPNTYLPNGHSIVACEIPAFTNLYHGRRDEKLPSSPEWFAFDAEMSYGIMGSSRNSHLLTYQNIRPVPCLYFDGMSAALMGTGALDSQMVFLCGNTTCSDGGNGTWRSLFDEYARAAALCGWVQRNELGGLGWGIEGVVRMNAGFEMIWCNFTSPTLRLISHVNVSVPLLPEGFKDDDGSRGQPPLMGERLTELMLSEMLATQSSPATPTSPSGPASDIPTGGPDMPMPPNWRSKAELEPFLQSQSFEWFRSATWHTGSSGSSTGRPEGRVKPNFCGFLSYYDSMLEEFSSTFAETERIRLNLTADGTWKGPGRNGNHSLALKELSTRRREHNLSKITNDEAALMSDTVLRTLRALDHSSSSCTGVDWTQKAVDITSRFSEPLTQVLQVLTSPPSNTTNTTLPSTPAVRQSQTSVVHELHATLLPTEQSLLDTIDAVLSIICNITLSFAFSVEQTWQTYYQHDNNSRVIPAVPESVLHPLVSQHRTSISLLRAWLGWFPDEIQCDRVCAVDEFCFIPIWPLLFLEPRGRPGSRTPPHRPPDQDKQPPPHRRPPPGRSPWGDLELGLWEPRCVKVLD